MRGGEFPELRVQDVEDTGSQLIVTILKTKTDYPRTFVIGPEYRNKILQYKALRPKNSNTDSQSSATVTHTLTSTIQTAPNLQLTAHPMTEAPKIYSTPITSSAVTNTVTSNERAHDLGLRTVSSRSFVRRARRVYLLALAGLESWVSSERNVTLGSVL
ncbi:hypothetical protein KQX54_017601 [Cotesia glomerata]|uniref:Uncharacterized protein n=1 Tax=Cotesia glomerata TaxID=32391 RepID=A0AAV7IXK9_COTGL|nr:hypothetical protein KQX54_017601 [Cotesia glomerata]